MRGHVSLAQVHWAIWALRRHCSPFESIRVGLGKFRLRLCERCSCFGQLHLSSCGHVLIQHEPEQCAISTSVYSENFIQTI